MRVFSREIVHSQGPVVFPFLTIEKSRFEIRYVRLGFFEGLKPVQKDPGLLVPVEEFVLQAQNVSGRNEAGIELKGFSSIFIPSSCLSSAIKVFPH